ncbi:MAG: hypothetical protein K0R31_48 [Clostridiales bacterium]|jgi:tripartite-type tricarboxylate transporter receptor subunit TctC|nr:hypothetical protein [Clostridiales bacterium]
MKRNFWKTLATAAIVMSLMATTACSGGKGTTASSSSNSSSSSSSQASPAPAKTDFPKKEVTIIVPYPAGGGTDMTARALAKSAEKYLGKSVIVVNKTGGSGLVGYTEGSTNVKPDGYNVTFLATDLTMLPHLVNTPISYQSFKPVMLVNSDTAAITVRADAPWNTVKEFLDYAKANPGKVKMGHGGVGSNWHIVVAALEKSMDVKFNQVPFESGGATIPALLGGHIDAVPVTYAEVKQNVDNGKLKTLAVLESNPSPEVIPSTLKTFEKETGVKPTVQGVWRGLAVPKDTPDDIVKILTDSFTKAAQDQDFKDIMKKSGLGIVIKDSKDFGVYLKENHEAFGKIISGLGLKK